MKIGILTIQGLNHGSFLQGFALRTYLENLGHKVSFINNLRPKKFLSSVNSLNILFEIKKNFSILSAWKNQPMKTRLKFYDTVVIGSDIVWAKNTSIYYGHGINANKTIAYAPCCSDNTYEKLDSCAVQGLKKMDGLSARDTNTAKMVEMATGRRPPIVLDPSFLIDWTSFEMGDVVNDGYILIYSYTGKLKSLRKKALSMDKPLVSVGNYLDWCDLSIPDASPFEFLKWVKHADYVLTDTFHGTAFSLIYQKPFASFLRSHKVSYQLKTLGISPGEIFNDYKRIEGSIRIAIDNSKKYLDDVLFLDT